MNNIRTYAILFMVFMNLISSSAAAQALHWLSKPEQSLGMIQNGDHNKVRVSANGRYMSFFSEASNLVIGDVNQAEDLFVYDRQNGDIQIASLDVNGIQADGTSLIEASAPTSDGQWVAFIGRGDFGFGTTSNIFGWLLYLKNLQTGQLQVISMAEGIGLFTIGDLHLSDDGDSLYFTTDTSLDPRHTGSNNRQLYRMNLSDQSFTLISVNGDGIAANSRISDFAVSVNGRFLAFSSRASNLVTGLMSNKNVFLIKTDSSEIQLVTVTPEGEPSADASGSQQAYNLSVSNSGLVAYQARNNDLVEGDTNGRADLFLFDGNINTRINVDENGIEVSEPELSYVLLSDKKLVFSDVTALTEADTDFFRDVYAYDIESATLDLITIQNNSDTTSFSQNTSEFLSAGGEKLIITSSIDHSNNSDNSNRLKIFEFNLNNQQIEPINPLAFAANTIDAGVSAPLSSSDQMSVVYTSKATNLTTELDTDLRDDVFLLNRRTNTHQRIARKAAGASISPSGRFVAFTSRFNQPEADEEFSASTVYLYDLENQSYRSIGSGNATSVNDIGSVAFSSTARLTDNDNNNFTDVYLYDATENNVFLISEGFEGEAGNSDSSWPKINGSPDNTQVVFSSKASDLLTADDMSTDFNVFVRSWPEGTLTRISRSENEAPGNGTSFSPDISFEGEYITFISVATNLTEDDYSNTSRFQGFLYESNNQRLTLISKDSDDQVFVGGVASVSISDSGRYIAYHSTEQVLPEDADSTSDVYLYDQSSKLTTLISKPLNNSPSDDNYAWPDVTENSELSPVLVGVSFSGQGDLTNAFQHPGYNEAFLYQQGGPDVNLNVVVNGFGSVSGSQGVSCMTDCNYSFSLGTDLTLIASPDAGFVFDRWQSSFGQCSDDTNPCVLTIDREKQLNAIFIDENDVIFKNGFD